MPRRLPAIRPLADELRAVSTGRGTTLAESVSYLIAHRQELKTFEDIEDLALDASGESPTQGAPALAHHLLLLRQIVARELYSRGIFVGVSVLDDVLFFAARDENVADPLLATLEFLRDRRINRPGLVLMPLHGFGIIAGGWTAFVHARRLEVLRPQWELALTPQTNNMRLTIDWLSRACRQLGITKPVNADLLYHYHRSRARWLERNPLVAVRVVNVSYTPYETQRLLMARMRAATGLLALAAAFQPDIAGDPVALLSTSRTNNFETRDIHHYVVFSDHPAIRSHLESHIVPINVDREDVQELTDLSIQLDPRARQARRVAFTRIERAVADVYGGWLRHTFAHGETGARGRVYRKAFESLSYFRRSYVVGGGRWSSAVTLAIAFEMLLTDSYGRGVTDQIVRRVGLVLRGVRGRADHQRAVRQLLAERGNVVHRGQVGDLELGPARRAYAEVFARLGPQLAHVQPAWSNPLTRLIGDPGGPPARTSTAVPLPSQ